MKNCNCLALAGILDCNEMMIKMPDGNTNQDAMMMQMKLMMMIGMTGMMMLLLMTMMMTMTMMILKICR